jgi:hypothetical protein
LERLFAAAGTHSTKLKQLRQSHHRLPHGVAIESHATAAFDHKRDSRLAIQSDRTRGAFGM